MRRFADELRSEGFSVDYRIAPSMREGVQQHIAEIKPSSVVATEPNSYAARELVKSLGIQTVPSDQFLFRPDLQTWQKTHFGKVGVVIQSIAGVSD